MRSIAGFAFLVVLLRAGDWLAAWLPLRLPGALIGMVLLALSIMLRPLGGFAVSGAVIGAGDVLLRRYALFFVPAGVGVMTQFAGLDRHWLAVLVALVSSSLLALGVTGLTMHTLLGAQARRAGCRTAG